MSEKVMVAMSGGVDSSVAAVLLQEQGYEVCGATLKLFSNENIGIDETHTCCSLRDIDDARSVARRLGISHYVFNFGDDFKRSVIERFANGYVNAETPNPCIDCNRYIKFGKLLERATLLEQDFIATGHYAQVGWHEESGRYLLKKAKDASKDQTYVLYAMTQAELSRTLFPLGALTKGEVRATAGAHGLANSDKPDSQDICFVRNNDYAGFLENVMGIPAAPGEFVDESGKALGRHKGLIHYTIGQRKGLGLSFDRPKYVIKKDKDTNTVVLGDESALLSRTVAVGDVNLISVEELTRPMAVTAKTRYSQAEVPAVISPLGDGRIQVEFASAVRAATPGQAAVFYDGDTVVGGGTILYA